MTGMFDKPQTVTINGTKIKLSALTFGDISDFCGWVRAQCIRELARARGINPEAMTPGQYMEISAPFLKVVFGDETCANYWDSREGMLYMIWLSARHGDPELSFEAFREKISSIETSLEVKQALVLVFQVTPFLRKYVVQAPQAGADNGGVGAGAAGESAKEVEAGGKTEAGSN